MRWWISFTMSSNERSSWRRAVTSWYSTSITASRSPSSATLTPVVVLIIRMALCPEALDARRLVGVDFYEVLRARQCQHRLDPLLYAGELQLSAGAVHLPVQIHEAADGGAVHVGDGREVDQDVPI